jgi:hypothetical protein
MISEILRKELDRFEKTKGKEMSKALKEYAKENMDTTVQVSPAFVLVLATRSLPRHCSLCSLTTRSPFSSSRSWISGRSCSTNCRPPASKRRHNVHVRVESRRGGRRERERTGRKRKRG